MPLMLPKDFPRLRSIYKNVKLVGLQKKLVNYAISENL